MYLHQEDYAELKRLKREIVIHRVIEVIAVVFVWAVVALFITGKICL